VPASKPTLTLDRALLDAAARDLGLKLDVRCGVERLRNLRRPTVFIGGKYDGVDCFNPAHQIRVNPYQTPEAATASLVHELIHASQCERLGSWPRFDAEYERQLADAGIRRTDDDFYVRYRTIPFEREAFDGQVDHPFGLILSDGSGRVVTS
jgi:hypothetical protein